MAVAKGATTGWRFALQRWAYNRSYFNQLGLMRDDTLHESEDVKVALKRIPDKLYDERMFRISRALNLSNQKTVLPKEEWTQLENDTLYLTPYVKEVKKEREERSLWNGQ